MFFLTVKYSCIINIEANFIVNKTNSIRLFKRFDATVSKPVAFTLIYLNRESSVSKITFIAVQMCFKLC